MKVPFDINIKTFNETVQVSIEKYEYHNSINLIKNIIRSLDNSSFSFKHISYGQTLSKIQKLNPKKATYGNDTAVKITKENKDLSAFYIHHNFKNSLSNFSIQTALKYLDVRPFFKKDDKTDKENYRPASILPTQNKYMRD